MLTRELFRFEARPCDDKDGAPAYALFIGTPRFPVGELAFVAHRPFGIPNSITIRRDSAGRWFVSFCYEHASEVILRTPAELAYELAGLPEDDLKQRVLGLDRNVTDNYVATSDGTSYRMSEVVAERIARKARGRRRQQKRLARQQKGSRNRQKTKKRIARQSDYCKNARRDAAHQISATLVKLDYQAYVLEALKVANMTRAPAPKQAPNGRFLPNGARAKAGLNKAILESCWGSIEVYLTYKALRANKLVLKVPAHYTSQSCSRCGHTAPGNRKGSLFACTECGWSEHADSNAAKNIAARGVTLIRSGEAGAPQPPKIRVAIERRIRSKQGGTVRSACGDHVRHIAQGKPVRDAAVSEAGSAYL